MCPVIVSHILFTFKSFDIVLLAYEECHFFCTQASIYTGMWRLLSSEHSFFPNKSNFIADMSYGWPENMILWWMISVRLTDDINEVAKRMKHTISTFMNNSDRDILCAINLYSMESPDWRKIYIFNWNMCFIRNQNWNERPKLMFRCALQLYMSCLCCVITVTKYDHVLVAPSNFCGPLSLKLNFGEGKTQKTYSFRHNSTHTKNRSLSLQSYRNLIKIDWNDSFLGN